MAEYAWTQQQAALLRDRKTPALDYDNLAEEIESLGKSQHRELGSRLDVLVMHLLKWRSQPSEHAGTWRSTIRTQRRELRRLLQQNPSLRPLVARVMADDYGVRAWRPAMKPAYPWPPSRRPARGRPGRSLMETSGRRGRHPHPDGWASTRSAEDELHHRGPGFDQWGYRPSLSLFDNPASHRV